jgi:hypothetical protein
MFVDRIKSPRCPKYGAMMLLQIIEPERQGFDSRTFECPKCYGIKTLVASIYREEPSQLGHHAIRSQLPSDSASTPSRLP